MKIKPPTKVHKMISRLIDADNRTRMSELEQYEYSVITLEVAQQFTL